MPKLQSDYRKSHSIEMVMFQLIYDFSNAIDERHVTLFGFLDVSPAFDMENNNIYMTRLSRPSYSIIKA